MYKFTTILWDVDGTLLDFLYSQRYAITKCFQSIGRDITEEMIQRYSQINDRFWKQLELGEITKEELLTGRFLCLFEEYGIENVDVESFRLEYQEALGSTFSYIDDSLEVCKTLYGKVKQYVVTNGVTSTQLNKLKLSGLDEWMEELFISEQIGAPKPQKEFFDYCFSQIEEKDKSKILLVGDSLTSDIKGGVLAGIATCWYRMEGSKNYTSFHPDYEISDLHQILDILQSV
ncbi:MAG: YjjG family noncanonical pyrimidine nucleotidase [Lachnospiraceae bacterium]|nr:YjjG family noncanonical pyrimidine nucleotidase [Lachnospiraceae bacterium]